MTRVTAAIVLLREPDLVAVVARGADRAGRRDAALRRAVAELTGANPEAIELGAETCADCGRPHGAPFATLAGERGVGEGGAGERIRLSLAHAGQASVAVAAHAASIGADAVDTARTDHDDPRGWARLEAVLKADGRGLRVAPERIRFADAAEAGGSTAELDGATYRLIEAMLDTIVIAVAVGVAIMAAPEAAS